jgi:hypothetical protein
MLRNISNHHGYYLLSYTNNNELTSRKAFQNDRQIVVFKPFECDV